jgi:WG containing repeat
VKIIPISTVLILAFARIAAGQEASAQVSKQQTSAVVVPTGSPCLFDVERGEIPNCVGENAKGDLFIAPEFLKELMFDSHGLAVVRSARNGWMYVSRTGKVLIKGVPVMDNWADSFHDGLVRIVSNGKYGFANREGQMVIPPIYDGAMNFENGRAVVCNGCESRPANGEGEYHFFAWGTWFRINTKGRVLGRGSPPAVPPATIR